MESFEDLFRDELDYIQQLAEYQAKDRPHLLNFLPNSRDPDVVRLVEGFTALTARLRQKITDDFPEISQNLLSEVWPLPLRPIPSTSIMQFSPKNERIDNVTKVVRNSLVFAEHGDQTFTFHTCHDLHIEPLAMLRSELTHSAGSSQITLTLRYDGRSENWQQTAPIRLFLGADTTLATTLMLWFDQYLAKTTIQYKTYPLRIDPVITGWQPDVSNLILPIEGSDFWPLQLLPELFYLPHVHSFLTLDLSHELPLSPGQEFAITFVFEGIIPIESIDGAFILHCVPAVNLYDAQTAKINFQHDRSCYTLPLSDHALFDISSVVSQQEPESGLGASHLFRPISAAALATHRFSEQREQSFFYETRKRRDPLDRELWQLMFYQYDGKPMVDCHLGSFVCHYTAFDKRAERLGMDKINMPSETIQSDLAVSNITPVTPHYPMMTKSLWPLLSLLQLNSIYLNDINAIKAIVKLFDFYPDRNMPLSRQIQRSIDGLIRIVTKPIDRLRKGRPFRGLGITLTMDERCYDSDGEMYQFATALNSLFSVSQAENSFICMEIVRLHSQQRWSLAQVNGHRRIM